MHSTSLLKAALKRGLPQQKSFTPLNSENSLDGGNQSTAAATTNGQTAMKRAAVSPPPAPPPSPSTSSSTIVKRSCLCAPTNHPGSFRCRLHRSQRQWPAGKPLKSPAIKPLQRPATSEGVLSMTSSRASLPPKKFVARIPLRRSSVSAHESRPSRLNRMETAATVSSNSPRTLSSRSSSPGSIDTELTTEREVTSRSGDEGGKLKPSSALSTARKEVEIISNSSAILEDDYKCALQVIQISQFASEITTENAIDHPCEVAVLQ